MAVQVGTALTQTGVYPWSATITVTKQGGGTVQVNASGYVPVLVRDSSAYGAGWGIDGIDQLFPISANRSVPAGLLWVTGACVARVFTSNGTRTYPSPEEFRPLTHGASNLDYTPNA